MFQKPPLIADKKPTGFVAELDRFIDYAKVSKPSISHATVAVTEKYARKKLELKKGDPLIYKGLSLSCCGSKRWRNDHQSVG